VQYATTPIYFGEPKGGPKWEIEKSVLIFYDGVINEGGVYMKQFKILVEKHPDGYVAYPLGLKGIVVGQGDTYEEALSDVKSAIRFHIETFGREVLEVEPPILEAFVAEAGVEI
jgi:predicted RNase H-like HicB family nuclease